MEVAEQHPECEVCAHGALKVDIWFHFSLFGNRYHRPWAIGKCESTMLTQTTLQVIGIDIYPYPVPEDIPSNLDFQIDDLNSP